MKVITNVTLLTKGARGQAVSLAPGEHDLPTEVAEDAIERGFAVEAGKASAVESTGDGGNAPSILDGTVPEIVAQLDGLDAEALDKLAAEEAAGKNRKGLLEAIEEAKDELSK